MLAESCSRVCLVEVLCEGSCVMHHYNRKPIDIGRLQRFAMESFYASGAGIPTRGAAERQRRSHASVRDRLRWLARPKLRLQGFQVTVIDRRALPGGLNTYGVAEYKLRATDSLREIEMIRGSESSSARRRLWMRMRWQIWRASSTSSFWGWGWERCTSWIFRGAISRRRRCAGLYRGIQDRRAARCKERRGDWSW